MCARVLLARLYISCVSVHVRAYVRRACAHACVNAYVRV